jgi:hypothetical protein
MKGIGKTGRTDPKKRILSFSISYKSLCTTFPQLWINEIKDEKRNNSWGISFENKPMINPLFKKIKLFLMV